MLSVRIVTTDHYMAPPVRDVDVCYSEFRGNEVKRVPVMHTSPAARTDHVDFANVTHTRAILNIHILGSPSV